MTNSTSPVPIEELLEHAAWVQRLARRLVRDDATAQDVVQQTWLAGLRSPPTDRARVRGWLARVVRNFAHDAYRSRSAREARESRVARHESVTMPPGELLERAESSQDVAAAVTRLAEPYRTAILRRYYEGLSAQDIAKLEGVPVETVRTWIKRGVEMIRADLRTRRGEGWKLALAPLCFRGGGGSDASASRRLRHVRRARKLRVAALSSVAALAVGAAWVVSRDGAPAAQAPRDERVDARPRPSPPTRDIGSRPRTRSSDGPPTSATQPSPTETPPASAPTTIAPSPAAAPPADVPTAAVRIAFAVADGFAAVPVHVVATPLGVGPAQSRDWAKSFDLAAEGGPIDLPRTNPVGKAIAAWDLWVEHPDLVPTHARVDVPAATSAPVDVSLPLQPAGVVVGVVRAPLPIGECAPWVAALSGDLAAMKKIDEAPVGADGGFRLRLAPGVPHRIVVAARGARPDEFVVEVPARELHRVDLIVLDEGGAITGAVEGLDGRPAACVHVAVAGSSDGRQWPVGPYAVAIGAADADWSQIDATADDAGRFRFVGLRSRPYRVRVSAPGFAPDRNEALARNVVPGGAEERFVLSAGVIELRVTRDGAPLAGAELWISGQRGSTSLTADASGRARLFGEPGVKYDVKLLVRGAAKAAAPSAKLTVVAPELGAARSEQFETNPAVSPAALVVKLHGPTPPARAGVALFAEGVDFPNGPEVLRDVAFDGGVVRLDRLPPGRFRVVVRPGGRWDDAGAYFVEQSASVELRAGGETSAEFALEAAGRLSLGARTPDGRFVAARCVLRTEAGEVVHFLAPRREVGWSGEFRDMLSPSGAVVLLPALRPGVYSVACTVDGAADVGEKRVVVRAGEVVEAIVELAPR
jgi:RNA polymerase sigma-70 factor (ECF subfamily)